MTTTIGKHAIELLAHASLKTVVDAMAAILLIVVLVEHEFTRAAGQQWRHQRQVLGAAAMPLLTTFAVAMTARLVAFL